jgi:delta24-sterol reductase
MTAAVEYITPMVDTLLSSSKMAAASMTSAALYLIHSFGGELALGSIQHRADKLLCHVITNYRPLFALFVLMPLSFIFDICFYLRNRFEQSVYFSFRKTEDTHLERVKHVQKQIRDWNDAGRPSRLCTARPGWMAMSLRVGKYKNTLQGIDLSALRSVLEVNEEARTVHVEPNVTMGQLTATLGPRGWTVPVLPELDSLTVGGLICGVGVETSSHNHGLFQHTCVAYELVLSDGTHVRCTKEENPKLFKQIPWSYGTLGMLVGAEIKIIPKKPFVKLTYHPCHSLKESVLKFTEASNDPSNDFVESLAFSQNAHVVMTGNFSDGNDNTPINAIGKYYKPWFFKHVQQYLGKNVSKLPQTELIPLRDYYHRHTRSIFWEIEDIVPFGNHPLFRYTLGWLMPPHITLLKRTQTEELRKLYEEHHVVQDMLLPISKLEQGLEVFKEQFDVFPLWLCPMRIFQEDTGFISPTPDGEEMFVDVGAYGTPKCPMFTAKESCRKVEHYVQSVHGFQMLYADTYTTREEFRNMFHHETYDALRKELQCEDAFPEVYDKVCKKNRH